MVVTGVRSSWEASATKRRSRSWDAARSVNASSRWSSIWLSATPSCPASVDGETSGTRRERSPLAICSAVRVICLIGRMPSRTTHQATAARSSRTMPVATASSVINRVIVSSTSVSGIAVIQKDPSGKRVGPDAIAQVVVAGGTGRERLLGLRALAGLRHVDVRGRQRLTAREVRREERGLFAGVVEAALVDVRTTLVSGRRIAGRSVVETIGRTGGGQPAVDLIDEVGPRGRRDDDGRRRRARRRRARSQRGRGRAATGARR